MPKGVVDYEGLNRRPRLSCFGCLSRDHDEGALVGADGRIRPPQEWRECFTLEEAVADAPPSQDTSRLV